MSLKEKIFGCSKSEAEKIAECVCENMPKIDTEKIKNSAYAAGIVEMAAACMDNGGYSRMTAVWLDPENYKAQFLEETGFDAELCEGNEITDPVMDYIVGYFGADDYKAMQTTFSLVTKLRLEFGEEQRITEPAEMQEVCEKYSGFSGGNGPYYIVENMFLVFFERAVVLFVSGSDE